MCVCVCTSSSPPLTVQQFPLGPSPHSPRSAIVSPTPISAARFVAFESWFHHVRCDQHLFVKISSHLALPVLVLSFLFFTQFSHPCSRPGTVIALSNCILCSFVCVFDISTPAEISKLQVYANTYWQHMNNFGTFIEELYGSIGNINRIQKIFTNAFIPPKYSFFIAETAAWNKNCVTAPTVPASKYT